MQEIIISIGEDLSITVLDALKIAVKLWNTKIKNYFANNALSRKEIRKTAEEGEDDKPFRCQMFNRILK